MTIFSELTSIEISASFTAFDIAIILAGILNNSLVINNATGLKSSLLINPEHAGQRVFQIIYTILVEYPRFKGIKVDNIWFKAS